MAEFRLPKNSRIGKGKAHEAPPAAGGRVRKFRVYRYDPESGQNPRYDTYDVDLDTCGRWSSTRSSRSVRAVPDADLPPLCRGDFAAPVR